jgi:hypothetical protein
MPEFGLSEHFGCGVWVDWLKDTKEGTSHLKMETGATPVLRWERWRLAGVFRF